MRKFRWLTGTLVAGALMMAALAPTAGAKSIIGNWTTTCPTYYFTVTGPNGAGNGSCSSTALPNPSGYTVLPATIAILAGNPGTGLGSTRSSYCALVSPCPASAASARLLSARTAQNSSTPCVVPGNAGAQFADVEYVSPGVYSASWLVIGVTTGQGAGTPSCSLAATAATIALSSTGNSFVVSYKGYSASQDGGLTYNRPFTYSVRYVLGAPKAAKKR